MEVTAGPPPQGQEAGTWGGGGPCVRVPSVDDMAILLSHPSVAARPVSGSAPLLDVDLAAVGANTALIARRPAGAVMAVVKADGFGHGAVEVARTALANGATALGVTSLAEAWPLRDAGLEAPLLSWLNAAD